MDAHWQRMTNRRNVNWEQLEPYFGRFVTWNEDYTAILDSDTDYAAILDRTPPPPRTGSVRRLSTCPTRGRTNRSGRSGRPGCRPRRDSTMIFQFRPYPGATAGRPSLLPRDRPILDLHIHGPAGARKVETLVDTGADDVLLPVDLLRPLGLNLARARSRTASGVGSRFTTYFFPVELEIVVAANDRLRWATPVGFGPTPPGLGLFGVAGGLEFFHLTMSVVDGWFALAPHPLVRPLPPTAYPHSPLAAP